MQIDEPALVTDISADAPALAERVYNALGALDNRPAIHVATYFGDPGDGLAALARTPVEAIGVDLVYGADTAIAAVPELAGKTLVAGIVDGRNIWRTDLEAALGTLASLLGTALLPWLFPHRARRCTCRTRWSPRPTWTTRCAAGWRSAPKRCTRSSHWQRH